MPSGTGLDKFAERFPERCFDVGIAEQHAVTFAAGLASEGMKPFARSIRPSCSAPTTRWCTTSPSRTCRCASPSTAPGWSAPTAPTHAGSFDVAYLGCLPGFVVMAAADEAELMHMVATAAAIDDRPSAFRYPRGEGIGVPLPERGTPLRDRQGPHPARGHQRSRSCRSARGCRNASRRRDELAALGLSDHRRRRALRQAARHRSGRPARPRPRGADPLGHAELQAPLWPERAGCRGARVAAYQLRQAWLWRVLAPAWTHRRRLRWRCPRDLQELGIDRLATWGISGGGPHVLACAALLPDLVTAAASLASLAPN